MVIIYGLQDAVTKECRYIGKTAQTIKERLRGHTKEANKNVKKNHKDNWVKKVNPEIFEVDIVEDSEWQYWERFYIQYFKMIGCRLLNGTIGGDSSGMQGHKHTEISKIKIGLGALGRVFSVERNDKIRQANLGKKWGKMSEQEKLKRSIANKGKPVSQETRLKISLAKKGWHPTSQTKQRMSVSALNRKYTENTEIKNEHCS